MIRLARTDKPGESVRAPQSHMTQDESGIYFLSRYAKDTEIDWAVLEEQMQY